MDNNHDCQTQIILTVDSLDHSFIRNIVPNRANDGPLEIIPTQETSSEHHHLASMSLSWHTRSSRGTTMHHSLPVRDDKRWRSNGQLGRS
jgi:hypothetical protein